MKNDRLKIFNFVIFAILFFFTRTAYAQVVINEIQLAPINERFIELYNPDNTDVDLTGWYIQRKTDTGVNFDSLVTSTQFNGKKIKANGYFLISRSALGNSDIVADKLTLTELNTIRLRDAKGKDVDQIKWGSIEEWKSSQRTMSGDWIVTVPTPGSTNNVNNPPSQTSAPVVDPQTSSSPQNSQTPTSTNLSNFPVEPQIIAEAGTRTRTAPAGAPLIFVGKVFGLKKEPIENARMIWSFGDGAHAEGTSVNHAYYYPDEYIVVLEASSWLFAASDRVKVLITTPNFVLRTGGDSEHSFVVIENHTDSELDLSGWHVSADRKIFIFPKNTFLSARKTVTLASEITGLMTPVGSIAFLHFPNGSLVKTQNEVATILSPTPVASKKIISKSEEVKFVRALEESSQKSSVLDAFSDTESPLSPTKKERSMWPWYTGVAFLGAGSLLGLRFARSKGTIADEFKIIEDKN